MVSGLFQSSNTGKVPRASTSVRLNCPHASVRGSRLESNSVLSAANCWRRFSIAINQDIANLANAAINDDGGAPR